MAYGRYRRYRRSFKRKLPFVGLTRREHRGLLQGNAITRGDLGRINRKHFHGPKTHLFNIYRSSLPFPQIYTIKQSYSEIINMTVGTLGLMGTERVFSLNDMYDPDYSATGHQPYARDTMAGLYSRYKVLGVWVDVTFYGASTNTVACAVGLSNPADAVSGVIQGELPAQVAERNNAEVKFLSSNGSQKQSFRMYVSIAKLMQITKLQFKADVDRYSASVNSSPSALGFLRLAIGDTALGSSATANASVKLTFLCTWYQRKTLASS